MNPRNWRIVAMALGGVAAVLGGMTVALILLPGGPGPSLAPAGGGVALPSVLGSPIAVTSPIPDGSASVPAAPSVSAPAPASAAASSGPIASSAPTAGVSSQPDPQSEPTATLTFVDLKLDGSLDAKGQTRLITFSTDGPGLIQAQFITHAPQGTARMCLKAANGFQACRNIANGTVVARAISGHNDWTVTLRGVGLFTPVADVVLTFPARSPTVTITHARFDGRNLEPYNGIRLRVAPRSDGNLHLVASWTRDLIYGVELVNATNGSGNVSLREGPARNTDKSLAVTGGATWKLTLRGQEAGHRGTDLTATISWP
jgi:uncharacterized protein YdeI (BOF family)